jgi:hypothetical protein
MGRIRTGLLLTWTRVLVALFSVGGLHVLGFARAINDHGFVFLDSRFIAGFWLAFISTAGFKRRNRLDLVLCPARLGTFSSFNHERLLPIRELSAYLEKAVDRHESKYC